MIDAMYALHISFIIVSVNESKEDIYGQTSQRACFEFDGELDPKRVIVFDRQSLHH